MSEQIATQLINRFRPVNLIPTSRHETLLKHSKLLNFSSNQCVLAHTNSRQYYHFLVTGELTLLNGTKQLCTLKSFDDKTAEPLEDLLSINQQLIANDQCQLWKIERSLLDALLSSHHSANQQHDYHVEEMNSAKPATDWMDTILNTPLISQLSPSKIQKLLATFEPIAVEEHEIIIKRGQAGSFFYVIKEGSAEIQLNNPSKQVITLGPGSYFGEEALVGNTVRNATVVMKSNGVLNRLTREDFEKTVKASLILPADPVIQSKLLEGASDKSVVLDVRLRAEFRENHLPNSINIPVSQLRHKIRQFDQKNTYYISNNGGSRSELAAFLLRVSGHNAFLMSA